MTCGMSRRCPILVLLAAVIAALMPRTYAVGVCQNAQAAHDWGGKVGTRRAVSEGHQIQLFDLQQLDNRYGTPCPYWAAHKKSGTPILTHSPIDTDSLRRALIARADTADAAEVFRLSAVFERGVPGVAADSTVAMQLLQRAADMKSPAALNYLGFKYYRGEGVPRDARRALTLIEEAAQLGDVRSYNNLGWLLAEGELVERDYAKAAYWLRRASDGGVATASAMLGDLYARGEGVPCDTLRADSLYTLAIDRGLADAQLKLLALRGGNYRQLSPGEAVRLGLRHYLRRGPTVGVFLFSIAAEKGDARAEALLGDACSRGIGTAYDHTLSIIHFYRAATAGYAPAQFVVAEMLDMFPDALQQIPDDALPPGTQRNGSQQYWYEQAAAAGITDAQTAAETMLELQ